jgi:hypothetical protein
MADKQIKTHHKVRKLQRTLYQQAKSKPNGQLDSELVNYFGKLDAGEPQVRFDEGARNSPYSTEICG